MATTPDVDPYFLSLVEMFQTSAYTALGKLVDPESGQALRNLEAARFAIDVLEMLERKTAGNLADAERRHLVATIDNLRLNYVDEVRADETAAAASPPPAPES